MHWSKRWDPWFSCLIMYFLKKIVLWVNSRCFCHFSELSVAFYRSGRQISPVPVKLLVQYWVFCQSIISSLKTGFLCWQIVIIPLKLLRKVIFFKDFPRFNLMKKELWVAFEKRVCSQTLCNSVYHWKLCFLLGLCLLISGDCLLPFPCPERILNH